MKHLKLFFALFAMLALGVGNAWAETATITFKNQSSGTSDGSSAYTISNFVSSGIASSDDAFGTITCSATSRCYSGKTGMGLKAGGSSAAGSFTITFSTPLVNVSKVTLNAAAYRTDKPVDITVTNGSTQLSKITSITNTTLYDIDIADLNIASFNTLTIESTKYCYIKSITITYNPSAGGENPGEGGGENSGEGEEPETPSSQSTATLIVGENGGVTWTNGAKTANATVGDVVFTALGSGSNDSKYYSSDKSWRFYTANTSGVKITTPEGSKIVSVIIKWKTGQPNTPTNWSKSGTSSPTTFTPNSGINTNEVSFTRNSSANFLAQEITVNYETSSSGSGSGETVPSLTAKPTTIDFGTKNIYFDSEKQGSLEIEVTGQNLTGNVTAAISGNDATKFELSSSSLTHNAGSVSEKLTVSYDVSEEKEYSATLTLSSDGVDNVELPITLKVINKEPATYVKVTNAVTDGDYLIVYEDATAPVAFNGALTTLDAVSNTVGVEINNNIIVGNTGIDAATFTIATLEKGFSIQSKSGYYIGQTSDANGLASSVTKAYENTLSIEDDGSATIQSSGACLRYNSASNQLRFRYYKSSSYSGQNPIALYKKASEHIVTIATCTNGSVSADVASGATVLSGTTITLENTPATGYKLTAYDVYKTGDATTKVTVTDGKFIMPEFDVTISATFELAKTLTSIEITNAATQTTFWQGETFNYTGLKVTAHFDGAADEVVTPTVTGSTATAGTQTVTVSYTEGTTTKTATYTITVKAIPNTKETAYTVADAFDIIDKLGDTDKMYITGFVSQADLVQSTIDQYKNADYWISADGTTNGQQLEAYRGKYLDNADFTSVNQIMVGDEVIIYGKLTKYGSTYEFAAGNYLVSLKRDKQQPELSYTTTEYNINLGDAFTAPTLNNPYSLDVTYSSNNEDVVTVAADGAVTIKAAGTVTITASFAGDGTYVTGSASYTINITDPNVSEATFVAGTDVSEEKSISKNDVTVEFTDGVFNRADNYRCYAGQSMTISYADGNITKIVIECTANDGAEYGPGQFTTETATYSYSGKVGTWTGEANSVTFTNIKQVRMTAITVYYKQDNRTDAGLAWNPATVSLTVGDAFTAPTFSNPNSVTGIEFTSSNDALATVSNAGVISLVSGKTGTATITATFAGDATYKAAKVTCTITVDHKSEDIVILAKCKDQYYALVAENLKSDVLKALPVEYVGGKIYNVETEDQASIIWKRSVVDGKTTFKNGDNYLSAVNSAALNLATEACEWVFDGDMYKIEGSTRTILYYTSTGGFKNYATTNMSKDGVNGEYSSAAITVAPEFADGDAYHRTTTPKKFGTICLPFGSTNYTGATFYEFVGSETGKVILGSVTTLVAGTPYIFLASATEVAVYGDGTTAATPGSKNGLVGTFTNDTEVAIGNYILKDNAICEVAATCWVNAYRAYIVMEDVPGEFTKMPGRRYIGMDVQGENVETGVEDLFTTDAPVKVIENGQLIIIRDGVKYNVQGQKL